MRQGHGRKWLVLAVVLFAMAAVVMVSGQGEVEPPAAREVLFPRGMRPQEHERVSKRRTYVAPSAVAGFKAGGEKPQPGDPVLAALPREGKTAVVIEANAIRHSPIGEALLECLMRRSGEDLRRVREETGLDPLEDVDRLVFTEEGIILSGHFGKSRLKESLSARGATGYDYGEGARLFEESAQHTRSDGSVVERPEPSTMGMWNDQLLVLGRSAAGVKQVLDRVEGRGLDAPPAISESQTYGEMYGVLAMEQLAQFLPAEHQGLVEQLKAVAQNVELHVDTRSDFAMVARVKGMDEAKVRELGKSLGAALAAGRVQAQSSGEFALAQMLDLARVRPDGSEFKLEMAMPLEHIQARLASCGEDPRPRGATPPPRTR